MHASEVRAWERVCKGMKKEDAPPRPALYTSDTTVAALHEILKTNNRGVLVRTEEFASWIGGMDGADRGNTSKDRADWLQTYDGGPHQINRVIRGEVLVDNWSTCILSAGTVEGIQQAFKNIPDDGLVQRFIPVLMRPAEQEQPISAEAAQMEWNNVLDKLRALLPHLVTVEPKARERFDAFRLEIRKLASDVHSVSPKLGSMLGKHAALAARAALTNHCIVYGRHEVMNDYCMEMAIKFAKKVGVHGAAFFDGVLGTSPALSLARSLARSLVADGNLLTTIGRQWMSDHCEAFKKQEDDRVRHEAVLILEDANFIEPHPGKGSYGGWPRAWNVHPRLWEKFSRQGEEWQKRRKAVADAIGIGNPDEIP
jgi:hypothetical protein